MKNSKSSMGQIGPNLGISWDKRYGVEESKKRKEKLKQRMKDNDFGVGLKHSDEFKIKQAERLEGSKNHAWRGGISFDEYCKIFSVQEFKDMIKERDNNICLNPSCKRMKTYLVIHHIDYDKQNCDLKNLICVCNSCNSLANTNREWHKSWYQAILYRRYNYEYK